MTTTVETKKSLKVGNTTYTLEKGSGSWVIFERNIQLDDFNSSTRENLSINLDTHEVYCNRTGYQTFGIRRYLTLVIRIENLFLISSLRDL